ncbi:response regulator transcription factor [Sphingomonas sp. MJ1 (PH-R8)]|uniref:response regulator transcription factor n=1 Tax=Sphingomonas sp. MJ1 (PH-R8) TaxID=3112950 RepID=UPI003A8A5B7B
MTGRRLLIVEDDAVFARTLARSFERRSYQVEVTADLEDLAGIVDRFAPEFAVVDLRLGGASGLACVEQLHAADPEMRIVVLTGFASIATAVEAIKLGATNYLTKPSHTDEIEAAFDRPGGDAQVEVSATPTTIKTLEWEHIHQTLAASDFNVSEAARRLGMHRRTLARKLEKRHLS